MIYTLGISSKRILEYLYAYLPDYMSLDMVESHGDASSGCKVE